MRIKNNKNSANYVNYKVAGLPKKSLIPAGKTADILEIKDLSQIINIGDFNRGFFELIKETEAKVEEKASPKKKKEKVEDSLEKVEKEVRNYTDKE
jgi:BRCT domain type II-containing protein